ncbi:MAG: MBL fold metallo-hydrolase [Vicinamibacteria bacterium]
MTTQASSPFRGRTNGDPPRGAGDGSEHLDVTFLGHSTVLFEIGGKRFLTDPILSRVIKIWPRLDGNRVRARHLTEIDVVLVSHAHMDHCDLPTLRKLPKTATIVTPQNLGDLVGDLGFAEHVELMTWSSWVSDGARVTAVPARHFGQRYYTDRHRGYCGYVVEYLGRSFYFSGDTAYFQGFARIGERFRIDVACLPIGAYIPRFIMQPVHTNPREAVQAFIDMRASYMVPIHWGTFKLSLEPMSQPRRWLERIAKRRGLAERVSIIPHGESRRFTFPEAEERTERSAARDSHPA